MPATLAVLVLLYGGLSSLFSLLTLGRVSTPPQFDLAESLRNNLRDILGHLVFGSLAFAPAFLVPRSKGLAWAMTGGFLAVMVDMDHVAAMAGLQTLGRASHSLGFMLSLAWQWGSWPACCQSGAASTQVWPRSWA